MSAPKFMFQSGLATDGLHSACAFSTATPWTNRIRNRTCCSVSSRHVSSRAQRPLRFLRLGTVYGRPPVRTIMTTRPQIRSPVAALGGPRGNPSSSDGGSNNLINSVLGYVISIIKGIIGLIGRIPGLLSSILSKEKQIIDDIGDSFEGAADAAEELVKGLAEVARVVEKAADTIADSAEEAQELLSKVTGKDSNGIADFARAIEHAADRFADSAEDANALLDKVEAQAKDIKEDVITAVENLEQTLKPLQEAVKKSTLESQNVEVDISTEKKIPMEDGTVVVEKVDAKVTVEKVDATTTIPENVPEADSVGTEKVKATVTVTQPQAEQPKGNNSSNCQQASWTSHKGLHISDILLSICRACLQCVSASYHAWPQIIFRMVAAALTIILYSRCHLDVPTVHLMIHT